MPLGVHFRIVRLNMYIFLLGTHTQHTQTQIYFGRPLYTLSLELLDYKRSAHSSVWVTFMEQFDDRKVSVEGQRKAFWSGEDRGGP